MESKQKCAECHGERIKKCRLARAIIADEKHEPAVQPLVKLSEPSEILESQAVDAHGGTSKVIRFQLAGSVCCWYHCPTNQPSTQLGSRRADFNESRTRGQL